MMGTWNIASGGRARGWVAVCAALWFLALPGDRLAAQEPELPIREIRGAQPGPTIAFVAGVHGGKVSAVRALDSIAARVKPADLRGTVLLVGPANLAGFRAGLAQTSPDDGLNLNRVFPGRADGQPTERLAARIMREVVARSDYLVDMHGSDGEEAVGNFAYAARPRVSPTVDSAALSLAKAFNARVIVWDEAGPRALEESRFLQTAAHLSGVPATTVFVPANARESAPAIERFARGALRVLSDLGMLSATIEDAATGALRTVERTQWASSYSGDILPRREVVTAARAGTWRAIATPATRIEARDLLGTLTDSLGHVDSLRATSRGIVLHQRLAGRVAIGTPLIIHGVVPDSTP